MNTQETALLQILKRALIEVVGESTEGALALRAKLSGLSMDTRLRLLGVDSMAALEVASYLEEMLGVTIPDDHEVSDATVGGLLRLLGTVVPERSTALAPKYKTLGEMLRTRARTGANRLALTFLGLEAGALVETGRLTYGQLYQRSLAVALALRERYAARSRILIAAELADEFAPLFFGCVLGGLVAVPVSRPTRQDRVAKLNAILRDSEATCVIVGRGARPNEPTFEDCLTDIAGHAIDAQELLSRKSPSADAVMEESDPDAVAFLQYTSGSTGAPKGVMVRHRDVLSNMRMIADSFGGGRHDVWVSWLPVCHDMGLMGDLMQPLHAGGTAVLMHPSVFVRNPLLWLEAVSKYRGTISGGPNFAYEMCVRTRARGARSTLDLSSWRCAYNGAEPVREKTLLAFNEAFGEDGFQPSSHFVCYGMAEATLFVAGGHALPKGFVVGLDSEALEQGKIVDDAGGDAARRRHRIVSCGLPARGMEVVVVDPTTLLACDGTQVGELWLSGPNVTAGYFERVDITQETFGACTRDGRGPFLRTGDLGFRRDGQVYITGRLKDLIIVNGRNLHPEDIEQAVAAKHEAFAGRRGAAFSLPGQRSEEIVVVQETATKQLTASEAIALREDVKKAVAQALDIAVADAVLVTPGSLPFTTSGKVRRGECRTRYLNGTLSGVPEAPAVSPP